MKKPLGCTATINSSIYSNKYLLYIIVLELGHKLHSLSVLILLHVVSALHHHNKERCGSFHRELSQLFSSLFDRSVHTENQQ